MDHLAILRGRAGLPPVSPDAGLIEARIQIRKTYGMAMKINVGYSADHVSSSATWCDRPSGVLEGRVVSSTPTPLHQRLDSTSNCTCGGLALFGFFRGAGDHHQSNQVFKPA